MQELLNISPYVMVDNNTIVSSMMSRMEWEERKKFNTIGPIPSEAHLDAFTEFTQAVEDTWQ